MLDRGATNRVHPERPQARERASALHIVRRDAQNELGGDVPREEIGNVQFRHDGSRSLDTAWRGAAAEADGGRCLRRDNKAAHADHPGAGVFGEQRSGGAQTGKVSGEGGKRDRAQNQGEGGA